MDVTKEVFIVVKLKKRGDTYKPAKLLGSIRKAGASPQIAKLVMKGFKVRSGMSTLAIRKQVSALLRKYDPNAAKKYAAHKK